MDDRRPEALPYGRGSEHGEGRSGSLHLRAVASLPLPMALIRGADRVILEANDAFCQLLDREEGSMSGAWFPEALPWLASALDWGAILRGEADARRAMVIPAEGGGRSCLVAAPLETDLCLLVLHDLSSFKGTLDKGGQPVGPGSLADLAAGVAHELNNPLAAVIGFAQLMMAQELSTAAREDLARILQQARKASQIVQDLLFFARKRFPDLRCFDVCSALKDAVAALGNSPDLTGVRVTVDIPPGPVLIKADGPQLRQAFCRILLAAARASGGVPGSGNLGVELRTLPRRIRVSFVDDGPQVPRQQLDSFFDPFPMQQSPRGGTGLGLSLAREVVRAHGGVIWAESGADSGTAVRLELPVHSKGPLEPTRL